MTIFLTAFKCAQRGLARKASLTMPVLVGASLLAGCASNSSKLVFEPVGPQLICAAINQSNNGSLVVYSDLVSYADLSAENLGTGNNIEHLEYSSYKILRLDGTSFKSVANNEGRYVLHPQQVELPAGEYRIVARADRYGLVTVPVVIAANRTTVLHLDGDGYWPRDYGFNATNSVHLPNGQIIGWRASNKETPSS